MARANSMTGAVLVEDSVGQAMCRLAQPLAQYWDNPFFAREILQLSRRRVRQGHGGALEMTTLISGCMMAVFLLIPFLDKHFGNTPGLPPDDYTPVVEMAAFCHGIFCLIAAWWGSTRIFDAERRARTLEAVVLLPYTPECWLALKLAFPLYALTLAWLFGLPCYLIAALLHYGSTTIILALPRYPLWASLLLLTVRLLFTANCVAAGDLTEPESATPAPRADSNALSLVVLAAWGTVAFIGWAEEATAWQMRHFYTAVALQLLLWLLVDGALVWAAAQVAMATLFSGETFRRQADKARWTALAIIYSTGLGFVWSELSRWEGIVAVLAGPIAFLLWQHWPLGTARQRSGTQASEPDSWQANTLGTTEVAWLHGCWNNAVFIKDLRVALRKRSLRGSGAYSVAILSIYWLCFHPDKPGFWFYLTHGGFMIFWVYLRFLSDPATRAAEKWQLEAKGATLTLLLLTPLRSDDIIKGRLVAALVASWAGSALFLLIPAAGLISIAATEHWGFAVSALALAPVPVAWTVLVGCSLPGSARANPSPRRRASYAVALRSGALARNCNAGAALQAAVIWQVGLCAAGCILGLNANMLPYRMVWAGATLLCLFNALLIPYLFSCQVARLEAARHGDMSVPKGN